MSSTTKILVRSAVVLLGLLPGWSLAQTVSARLVPFTEAEQTAFLSAHNVARKAAGLEPLTWSNDMAKYAEAWINHQLPALKDEALKGLPRARHRPREGEFRQKQGENLAGWGGTSRIVKLDPNQAVTMWLSEKADFDKLNAQKTYVVGDESADPQQPVLVGHYTQILWKQTRRLGAARAVIEVATDKGPMTYVIVICNYDPRGNIFGQKPY